MGNGIACNGTLVVATLRGLKEESAMVKATEQKDKTLCIFMGLKDVPALVSFLKKWYPGETAACLIYKAGYAASELLARTTIDGMAAAANKAKEKFLGLIYVGPCLAGGHGSGRVVE